MLKRPNYVYKLKKTIKVKFDYEMDQYSTVSKWQLFPITTDLPIIRCNFALNQANNNTIGIYNNISKKNGQLFC